MIAYVKGKCTAIEDEAVIVEMAGIGYEIICANPFIFQASLNKEIQIQTYYHVREDAHLLYGFKNKDEKFLFTKLISVSGIGPKSALAMMATVDIPEFVAAVEREDDKFLSQFPGVGKKTARQIILDLKGKLTTTFSISQDQGHASSPLVSTAKEFNEAKEALLALGYTDREIKAIMPQLPKDQIHSTDELVRKALALLMKK
ncbi:MULTISPECIES: Holliday junction branch migration protein RuvA [unclassified Virgibacillus]|uniref:Holliday junction branch migration protein RuvA n=1 Tax=unclassified Virgibacillus TaxID=2620237 RepID=UPI0024DE3366|nr:Holliday junction branch migration protein RuvA [Virgibacillus sp. LDC-1]